MRFFVLDADDRDVGWLVATDDLRRQFTTVGELDRYFGAVLDHVVVGEDEPGPIVDEPRSEPLDRPRGGARSAPPLRCGS